MNICSGTSGYAYKEWKGIFYPEKIPAGDMLGFYSERLGTVEINNTFYRMPSERLLSSWARQVPEDFVFALKAPKVINPRFPNLYFNLGLVLALLQERRPSIDACHAYQKLAPPEDRGIADNLIRGLNKSLE